MTTYSSLRPLCVGLTLAAFTSSWLVGGSARADVAPDPPSVRITSPADGAMFTGDPATFDVEVEASPGDTGIEAVTLMLDGTMVASSSEPPYTLEGIEVAVGMHALVAVAVEAGSGDGYASDEISIVVFAPEGTTGGTSNGTTAATDMSTGGGDDLSTTGGGTVQGSVTGPPAEEPSGCATASGTKWGGLSAVLGLLLIVIGRRRRQRCAG